MTVFDVATHNFGVMIAIWAPIVLVSGSEWDERRKQSPFYILVASFTS